MTRQERESGKFIELELAREAENWLLAEQIGVSIFDLRDLTVEEIEAKQAIEDGRRRYREEKDKIDKIKAEAEAKRGKRGS